MTATPTLAAQRHRSRWISGFSAITVLFTLAGCGGASSDADQTASGSSAKAKRASAGRAISTEPLAVSAGDVSVSAFSENGKLMRADENVGTLGNDLFGERVNLYDGSTEFVQTDVALPGNSALPVSVGRLLTTGNAHLVRGHFGDWDLDIPHLHGIFTQRSGWTVGPGMASATGNRCTQFGPPPQVLGQSNQGTFNPVEYWHGTFLYVPGVGSQEILKANTSAAAVNPTGALANTAVTPVKLTTKNRWTLICGTPLQGGDGEGFTAVSPDGTRYRFDQMVVRPYPQINKAVGTPPQRIGGVKASSAQINPGDGENFAVDYILKRQEHWILPTLVTDRFGNQVSYTYASPGSWRVTSITSTEIIGHTHPYGMGAAGPSAADAAALRALGQTHSYVIEGLTMTQLASESGLSVSRVSRVIAGLERVATASRQ